MSVLLDTILDHAAMLEQWTRCSVEDVPGEELAEQPPALKGSLLNHPAWILGHLAFAMDNVTEMLGGEVTRAPQAAERFGGGTTPSDDRSLYPAKEELVATFAASAAGLRRQVRAAGEAGLEREIEDERMRAFFPTVGRFAVHVLLSEGAFHTGQLSAWRRAKGLPAVFDSPANLERLMSATA